MIYLDTDPKLNQGQASPLLEEGLLKTRFVCIIGEITPAMAATVVRQLLVLDNQSQDPINVLVSSPGGHVESGDTIHDLVRFIRSPVNMIGSGWVASAGTHIFLAVPKERRFCLENTRFMIHQPAGGVGGKVTDIEIQARELLRAKERLIKVIARETGQPQERVAKDIDRDYWLSPEEAIAYGLVSRVVERAADLG